MRDLIGLSMSIGACRGLDSKADSINDLSCRRVGMCDQRAAEAATVTDLNSPLTNPHRASWTHIAASALDSFCIEGLASAELLLPEQARSFCRQLMFRLRHEWQSQFATSTTLSSSTSLEDSVNIAIAAAYAGTSIAASQREVWVTLSLTTLTNQIVRDALDTDLCTDVAERDATILFAEQLARTVRARLGDSVATNVRDPVANAARRAFAELHESAIAEDSVPTFITALFGHLRHGASQIRSGTTMDSIARAAVSRADRAEHGDVHSAWVRADVSLRRALLIASLCEASMSLARAAVRESGRSPEVAVGIARCAAAMLGATGESVGWLHETHEPSTLFSAISKTAASSSPALSTAKSTIHTPTEATPKDPAMTTINTKDTTPSPTMSAARTATGKVIETLENDAQDAAWRLAGSQFVKLMRDPLVGVMSRHLSPNDESMRARIAGFLETEVGTALLSAVLSAALSSLPRAAGPVPDRLARELRVRAMADAGDVVADLVMGPMRQVVALYLQDPGFQTSAVTAPSLEGPRSVPMVSTEERVASGLV